MPIAAIDARTSHTESHATRAVLSITGQIEQARAYARRQGWGVDEVRPPAWWADERGDRP